MCTNLNLAFVYRGHYIFCMHMHMHKTPQKDKQQYYIFCSVINKFTGLFRHTEGWRTVLCSFMDQIFTP